MTSEPALGPTLAGDRVTLRILEPADAPAWLSGEDEEQLRWFRIPAATLDDVALAIDRWRAGWSEASGLRQWGIWVDGGAVLAGGVEVRRRADRRANLSYVVFPAHRRRGVATEAARLASRWALDHLAIECVVAVVDEANTASRRVADAAGFTFDGRAEPWEHAELSPMLRYVFGGAIRRPPGRDGV